MLLGCTLRVSFAPRPIRVPEGPAVSETATELEPFVTCARHAIEREYPVALVLMMRGPEDLGLPREVTPVFRGSYDWHSAVHGHWTLARALRLHPAASWAEDVRASLARSLTSDGLAVEHRFVEARPGFERPYGLAWVLALATELRALASAGGDDATSAARWRDDLAPLETLAAERLVAWAARLPFPVRSGEHAQSAFAFGLALDHARATGHAAHADALVEQVLRLHRDDTDAPVAYEPSGQDFLSPVLGVADLMRRVMPRTAFVTWLHRYLPPPDDARVARWLEPVTPPDRSDGKFAHLDGLNLSRAWMLEGVVSALPVGHEYYSVLERAASRHARAGLEATRAGTDWMGTHWLASFATYLVTRAGLQPPQE